jgi:thermitase
MQQKCLLLGLLMAVSGCLLAADVKEFVPGRILVGRKQGADAALENRVFQAHGAAVRRASVGSGITVLDLPERSADAVMASLRTTGIFEYVERDYYAHTAAVPDDPSYGAQWHLPRIQMPQAWSVTTGAASVIVAVVDSGVDGTHPDLASKLVPGWNFVSGNANTSDLLGHGTAVAGTVGAASNNHIGVAGVNWASRVMPVVVVDSDDYAAYSDIAAGIQFAADHGARVINVSIGGRNWSVALQSAVDYAWNRGAVIFASAMNSSASAPYYPAACNHVLAVSATDSGDRLASYSNYGEWISLAAPGSGILTTSDGGGYAYWSGTSFASPVAAGVAALCLAVNPGLSPSALVSLLEKTADDIGAAGYDISFGYGRVSAYKAVTRAVELLAPVPPPVPPVRTPARGEAEERDPRPVERR